MYFSFKVSDESVNSKGFIVETAGIQLESFNNNPVALHNHDINQVIGNWENVHIDEQNPSDLVGTMVFDYSDPDSQAIMNKVSKNLIKHASIAIELIDGYVDIIDDEEIIIVTKSDLKEISITPLPANKNAVKLYYNGEYIDDSQQFINNNNFLKTENMSTSKLLELTEKVGTLESKVKESKTISDKNDKLNTELSGKLELKDKEILTLSEQVTDLQNKLNDIETAKETAKFNDLLDSAITEGKIKEDQKETFLKLSFENADAIISGLESKELKPEIKLTDKIENDNTKTKEDSDKDYRWYEKNDPSALELMYKEDKEKHDKLEKEFYG